MSVLSANVFTKKPMRFSRSFIRRPVATSLLGFAVLLCGLIGYRNLPVASLPTYARKMADQFGNDTFPYGIEANRPTWERMLRYTFEQGIAHRHAKPEEIFPKGIMTDVRI